MFHKMRKEFVYFYSRQIPYYLFPPPGGGREGGSIIGFLKRLDVIFPLALARLSFIQSQLIVMP